MAKKRYDSTKMRLIGDFSTPDWSQSPRLAVKDDATGEVIIFQELARLKDAATIKAASEALIRKGR